MLTRTAAALAITAALALALASSAPASQLGGAPGAALTLTDTTQTSEFLEWHYEAAGDKLILKGTGISNPNAVAGCTQLVDEWTCTGFTGLLIDLGPGDDILSRRPLPANDPPYKPQLHGGDGDDTVSGGVGDDAIFGDAGSDVLIGHAGPDQLVGGAGIDLVQYDDRTNPVTATIGAGAVSGEGGEGDTIDGDVEDILGGTGDDVLTGSAASNSLTGGPGTDTLEGLGGVDFYDGGGGDDILRTRDGNDERVSCGSGSDNATTDLHDLRDSCETVDESGALEPDADRDGYAKFRPDGKPGPDCNDDDAAIRPGRDEVFGNGKDDNCDQIVDRSLDADADGFRPPLDCNDGDANIRPLATEVRGNTVDENCDGLPEPLPSLRPTIDASWNLRGFRTINRRLIAEDVEAGTTITMTCNGNKCPFKTKKWTVKAQTRRKSLRSPLKGARLRPRVKLQIEFAKPGRVSKIVRYRMGSQEYPTSEVLCRTLPTSGPRRNCAA